MLPKETALSKLAKTMVKPITVKPPTKTTSSPTTTIPYDEWSKQIDELMAAVPVTTTPTTVPKVSALPKGYKPIGSQPAPEGTIGIDTKGNFFLGTGKVVRKENFKPGSSSVMYNPGPKTKTTTPKSPTPPVTVPKAYPELTTTQTPEEKTQDAIDASREAQAGATNLGITETKKKPGGWRGALANIVNFDIVPGKLEFKPIENLAIKPLIALDTGRRAAVSGFQESVEFAKDFTQGKQVYTATDYIPKHPQTGKPIARIGDPIIDNVDVILNTPIPIINNKTLENFTDRELQNATDKIVDEKGTTSGGSFKDWYKQTKDPTTGFGDIPYLKTGNKWLDRGIGFFGDVALDPLTYATLGGSAIVKPSLTAGSKAAVKAAERAAARVALETAISQGDDALIELAKRELAKANKAATRAAPRRLHGAQARETAANTVRQIRDDAAEVAADATKTAAERNVALKTVRVLNDDLIGEIATKGYTVIKGEAAEVLGVQNGLRWGLPGFNKFEILPKLSAPFADALGRAASVTRLNWVNTPAGAAILKKITPLGDGGLFANADILMMRTALRQGTAKGEKAADYVAMLAIDKTYRGLVNIERKEIGSFVRKLTETKDFKQNANKLINHLQTPEGQWAANGLPALTPAERNVYDGIRSFLDDVFEDADDLATGLGGPGIARIDNYFPYVRSNEAVTWAARNSKLADTIADGIGVDRTVLLSGNYMSRNIKVGSDWFGKILTADDIAGGVSRLNKIAKDSGQIKFNFFTEDVPTAIGVYAENHAKFKAYGQSLENITRTAPGIAYKRPITDVGAKASAGGLLGLETTILNLMTPAKLLNWSTDQIEEVANKLDELATTLTAGTIKKEDYDRAVNLLRQRVTDINTDIGPGVITPPIGGMLTSEAENFATALANQLDNVKTIFASSPASRWRMIDPMIKSGFGPLNVKTLPDIAIKTRNEIDQMFTNMKRLDDSQFIQAYETLLKDTTTFMKTYVTATPGFYLRNAIGNIFAMTAAGALPNNMIEGLKIYRKLIKELDAGRDINSIFGGYLTNKYGKGRANAAFNSWTYSGTTGYGQVGEVLQSAGAGKTGAFGKEATGKVIGAGKGIGKLRVPDVKIPGAKQVSTAAYAPFRGMRNKGSRFEEYTRFILLYDGIKQGYDPQTAAARANKYLIDYQDLSTLDKNVKQIIPFWMFFSRNLPLQIENMWMNPQAYAWYKSAKRNLEDREGDSESVPDYLKEQGAFKLPGTSSFEIPGTGAIPGRGGRNIGVGIGDDFYAKPDLAFPGAGQPNVLEQISSGNAPGVLGNLGPPFKQAIEIVSNTQLFNGAPITDPSKTDEENARRKKEYLLINIVPALGTAGRWLTPLGDKVPKTVRDLTGARLDAELQATLSLIGTPGFKLLESQERSALWRKYRDLKDVIKADTEARIRRAKADEGLLKDE
jgi:hypothetical protein